MKAFTRENTMKTVKRQILGAVIMSAAFALAGAGSVSAQTADVAGTWNLSVDVQGGVTSPTVTLEQDGETLTGSYSSDTLGEADVSGTVTGSDVMFSLDAEVQGVPLTVIYTLTLNEDGTLTGSIDIGGQASGSVTGTRSDM